MVANARMGGKEAERAKITPGCLLGAGNPSWRRAGSPPRTPEERTVVEMAGP
jgi:hypothetical protein